MQFPQACVVMFAKEPVAGNVKTRLIPSLGAQGACALHKALLQRQLSLLNASDLCYFQLWVDNNPQHEAFASFQGQRNCQVGDDLGEKMFHAAATVLQEFQYVVIIGSDCPQINEQYLYQALNALADGADIVLGPAADGGYVLLGLAKPMQVVFQGIDWGSAKVLQQTRQILRAHNIDWQELSTCFDIDRPEDLGQLKALGITF